MGKFLSLLKAIIFCEFFNFGFVTPLQSERKSAISGIRPRHQQRAAMVNNML